ncbi:site-specific DNA-methyltransferase [Psychrobacter pacificensis]|uniref:site-specific DNA-methyltransferase n=1 Tax=Psychrobacter pacificensis TaxID=112002 RepID=UPI003D091CD3
MTNLSTETLFDETETANSKQIAILKKHFPQCFDKGGHFQPEKMMEVVKANEVEMVKESYSLNWLGKAYARLLTNLPPQKLLKPDTAHNESLENSDSGNILIKGDNLEVLKHLVNGYREKIKMIYIDPPYNTGSDGFVYQDNFKFTVDDLSRLAGIDKAEAERILSFNAKGSNSHSAWLTFMYPRLYIARELMREDGVIFISIDDNEQAQLKLLCDEIFGEENFVGEIVWKNVTDNNPTNVAIEHEYILVYAKELPKLENFWKSKLSDVKDILINVGNNLISTYADKDELQKAYSKWFKENKSQLWPLENYKFIDEQGAYSGERGVHNPGKEGYRYDIIHPVTGKPCKEPLLGYRFPESTMNKMIKEGRIIFGKDEDKLVEIKVYAKDYEQKLSSVMILDGRSGTNEIKELFDDVKVFNNPKAVRMLTDIFSFVCREDDFVLDFFSGSGSSADAVMQLNLEDNGNRKFICVQIDELTYELDSNADKKKAKEGSKESFKAGYETIFDITKARIIKAAQKIAKENVGYQGDLGLKVFETIDDFRPSVDDELQVSNESLFDDMVLSDEQYQALLATWMLYDNNELTADIISIDLQGYNAELVNKNLYLIASEFGTQNLKCLLDKLDKDKSFAPDRIIVNGYNFDTAMQMELNEAIRSYQNKKKITINIIVRY